MNPLLTGAFWADAATRAAKIFAGSLLGALTTGASTIASVHWTTALTIAGTSALLSLLASVCQPQTQAVHAAFRSAASRVVRRGRHEANHPPIPEA